MNNTLPVSTAKKLMAEMDISLEEKIAIAIEVKDNSVYKKIIELIQLDKLNTKKLIELGNQFENTYCWCMIFKTRKIPHEFMLKICVEYRKKKISTNGMFEAAIETKLVPKKKMIKIIKDTALTTVAKIAIKTELFMRHELLEISRFIHDDTVVALINQRI